MEEGMARLKDERVVLHITDMILFHHLEETSKVVPGMHIFSEGRPEIKGPIITKNSPLGKTKNRAPSILFSFPSTEKITTHSKYDL